MISLAPPPRPCPCPRFELSRIIFTLILFRPMVENRELDGTDVCEDEQSKGDEPGMTFRRVRGKGEG